MTDAQLALIGEIAARLRRAGKSRQPKVRARVRKLKDALSDRFHALYAAELQSERWFARAGYQPASLGEHQPPSFESLEPRKPSSRAGYREAE